MIFYFSATGNSKGVAEILSKNTDEELISITDCIKNRDFEFKVQGGEKVGFVTPTYFFGLPVIVIEFLEKLKLEYDDNTYFYHVSTFGTTPGQSGRFLAEILKKKGIEILAYFGVKMVDTWTPMFDLRDKEKNRKQTEEAQKEAISVAEKVAKMEKGDFRYKKVPMLLSKMYYKNYEKIRKTDNFYVEDSCTGCKICEGICPYNAIEIKNEKPVWIKDKCVMCLACLHHCPTFSIQYGKKTKEHGQFVYENQK